MSQVIEDRFELVKVNFIALDALFGPIVYAIAAVVNAVH